MSVQSVLPDLIVAALLLVGWVFFPAVLELALNALDDTQIGTAEAVFIRFIPFLYVVGLGAFSAVWLGRPMEE